MRKASAVLVHGIFDRGVIFDKMADHLGRCGIQSLAPDFVPNNGQADLRALAVELGSHVDEMRSDDEPFFLVGYSMGGLICRYYMQRLGGVDIVDRWVTISTPHHGTLTAHGFWGKGVRQMRPGSPFLNALNKNIADIQHIPFLSIWTPMDMMIIPANSSAISLGINKKIAVLAHPLMYTSQRVIHTTSHFLEGVS